MRIKNLKTYYLKHTETVVDKKEGGRRIAFSQTAIPIKANIYDDEQKLVPQMQGIKSSTQKVMLFHPPSEVTCVLDEKTGQERYVFTVDDESSQYITVGDGVCVYVAAATNPDYRICSMVLCGGHLECVLERIYGRT